MLQRSPYPVNEALLARTGRYYPVDLEPAWLETIERVRDFTQTSPERLAAVCAATEYVVRRGIAGSFVECGVWRGGSTMAVALTLLRLGVTDRPLYLFDTFAGMTRPSEADLDYAGQSALAGWNAQRATGIDPCEIPLAEVREALASTGYDLAHVHFVEGAVEETLPDRAPAQIALLRLDTDWYESTRHELIHLYPRLAAAGVLIVDDYGHFTGARRATDEYFEAEPVLLARIDYTGRVAIKAG